MSKLKDKLLGDLVAALTTEAVERRKPKELLDVVLFDSYAEQVDELMKISYRISHERDLNSHLSGAKRGFTTRTWVPGSPSFNKDYVGREFKTWKDVRQAANSAWPHGLAVLEDMKWQLQGCELPRPQNIRRTRAWREDEGDELSLDRLQRGLPYWQTTHRSHRPGPLSVTIVTDVQASMHIAPDDILWRGAAAIILAEMLEDAGYRVELWVAAHSGSGVADRNDDLCAVCLKRGNDQLDQSSFINAVSGWSYRTVFFGSLWHLKEPKGRLGICYDLNGVVKYITPDEQVVVCEGIWHLSTAVNWVREQLNKFDPLGVKP